jgi:hypothetical protein
VLRRLPTCLRHEFVLVGHAIYRPFLNCAPKKQKKLEKAKVEASGVGAFFFRSGMFNS